MPGVAPEVLRAAASGPNRFGRMGQSLSVAARGFGDHCDRLFSFGCVVFWDLDPFPQKEQGVV